MKRNSRSSERARRTIGGFLLIVGVLVLAAIATATTATKDARAADIGGAFELVDHTGRVTTDADFRGKYLLVFFGYTYCPDVCPTELAVMGQALDELGDTAEQVQPLFIKQQPRWSDRLAARPVRARKAHAPRGAPR